MWTFIAAFAVTLATFYLFAPEPQNQPPPSTEDIEYPTAEEGKPLPVLFGCRRIRATQVLWYGNVSTKAIKTSGGKK